MRQSLRFAGALFIAVLFSCFLSGPSHAAAGTIAGRLTFTNGNPVDSALIVFLRDDGSGWKQVGRVGVAADGTYVSPEMAAGLYRVQFAQAPDGRIRSSFWGGAHDIQLASTLVLPQTGQVVANGVVQATPLVIFDLRKMPDDTAAPTASLLLQRFNGAGWDPIVNADLRSTNDGRMWSVVAPGTYRFGFRANADQREFGPTWVPGVGSPEQADVFTIDYDQTLETGRVLVWETAVLEGPRQFGRYAADVLEPPTYTVYRKDDDGNWIDDTSSWYESSVTHDWLRLKNGGGGGVYRLLVHSNAPGYRDWWYSGGVGVQEADDIVVTPGAQVPLNMVHRAIGGRIAGIVTPLGSRTPLPGRTVTLYAMPHGGAYDVPPTFVATTTTGADGGYAFDDLDPLSGLVETAGYWLKFEDPFGVYSPRVVSRGLDRIRVSPGATTRVDVGLLKGARIVGKVTDSNFGRPVNGVTVQFKNTWSHDVSTAVSQDGKFDSGPLVAAPTIDEVEGGATFDITAFDYTAQWSVRSISISRLAMSPGQTTTVNIVVARAEYPVIYFYSDAAQTPGRPFSLRGGFQDPAARGIAGRTVTLFAHTQGPARQVGTTVTDALGSFQFDGMIANVDTTYEVRFAGDSIFPPTKKTQVVTVGRSPRVPFTGLRAGRPRVRQIVP